MEADISVRYTFVMLLAIADPSGLVVGTDVALARRLNMSLNLFRKCIRTLQDPDDESNSKELDGRRIVPSEGERGYQIVNYVKYRDLKDEDDRRAYMRDYMQKYRAGKLPVNSVNFGKPELARLTQADANSEADAKEGGKAKSPPRSRSVEISDEQEIARIDKELADLKDADLPKPLARKKELRARKAELLALIGRVA